MTNETTQQPDYDELIVHLKEQGDRDSAEGCPLEIVTLSWQTADAITALREERDKYESLSQMLSKQNEILRVECDALKAETQGESDAEGS